MRLRHKSILASFGFILFFLFLFYPSPQLIAQSAAPVKISGTVTNVDGVGIPGVSVRVKGDEKNGVITDESGRYSLISPGGSPTILFSSIGYQSREVAARGRTNIDISLEQNQTNLDEVVVVAYGTQKKATISGAISTLGSEDIVRTPASTATSALVGKIAGVTARTTDARPGNGASINIRNLGNPLYVIDGVAYSTSNGTDAFGYNTGISGQDAFNQIGLEDIESISVLKDASASIYGLAAGNGVILVTTKRGKKSEVPKIGVNAYYGLQNFTRFPYPSNAGTYVRGLLQSEQNLGRDPSLLYSATELSAWENQIDQAHKSNDYFKFVMRNNVPQYNLNANVSGGTKNTQYYLSVSQLSQDAVIRDYKFKRTNFQSNLTSKIANGFTVGAQINGRLEDRHNVGVPGLDDFFNPLLSVGSMWPTEKAYANDNPAYINQTHNINVNPATYKNDVTGYIDDITRGVSMKLNAEYSFKFGLNIKGLYSYDYANEDFDGFEFTYPAYIYNAVSGNYDNRPLLSDGITPDPTAALYGNQNPWRETHRRNIISSFSQLQVNYAHQFGDHSLSGVVVYERRNTKNNYLASHTVPPNNIIVIQYLADLDYFADTRYEEAFEGEAIRLNYDYKKKYLLEAVARYDGSFLYQSGQQYGFFPGVTAGWRISEEGFFKKGLGKTINNLKLRLSYGETGTSLQNGGSGNYVTPAPFDYIAGYNVNNGSAVFGGVYFSGVRPRGLPTTNLSWIRNSMYNAGIDFDILHHISGQFDVYQRRRTGLPASKYDVVLPSEVGYSLPFENLNSDLTEGFDGAITYTGNVGRVNISIGGNATIGRSKTVSQYKPRFGNSYDEWRNSQVNRWANVNFGHHIIGRFTSQQEINDYPVNIDGRGNQTLLPGDFMYEDYNHDGVINNLDARPIGYAEGALPYFNYGINGRVTYQAFSLAFDFSGAGMQSYFRDYELKYPFQNNGNSPTYMLTDNWHRADPYDPNSAWISGTYPALRKDNNALSIYRSPMDNNGTTAVRNDFWLTNVRYLRLRNLELGYSVPTKLLKKYGIAGLRIYADGSNLFSFDNVSQFEIDPEISSNNGLVYPQQKIYTLGFNLTL